MVLALTFTIDIPLTPFTPNALAAILKALATILKVLVLLWTVAILHATFPQQKTQSELPLPLPNTVRSQKTYCMFPNKKVKETEKQAFCFHLEQKRNLKTLLCYRTLTLPQNKPGNW
jgi:hypothetical protein